MLSIRQSSRGADLQHPAEPARMERADDPVARLEGVHALPDLDDLAGGVAARDTTSQTQWPRGVAMLRWFSATERARTIDGLQAPVVIDWVMASVIAANASGAV
jgi:hypothetical protein